MKDSNKRSVLLSRICVLCFGVILAAMDILYFPTGAYALRDVLMVSQYCAMTVLFWLCSVIAWAVLVCLWLLLKHIGAGEVFIPENVSLMQWVSLCCFAVCLLCIVGTVTVHPSIFVLAIAAGFMGLIVRIVRNAFRQAIEMKDELDLTV